MTTIDFIVHGIPVPQGSKRHVGNGIMIEANKKLAPWRQEVTSVAMAAKGDTPTILGPVKVVAEFIFPRLKSHFGTGKNADVLKETAPHFVSVKPDLDKLMRGLFDALTNSGIWRDDSQAVFIESGKTYGPLPGMKVKIEEVIK